MPPALLRRYMSSSDLIEYRQIEDQPTITQQYLAQIAMWARNCWVMLHTPEERERLKLEYKDMQDMLLKYTPPKPQTAVPPGQQLTPEEMKKRIEASKAIRRAMGAGAKDGTPKKPKAPRKPRKATPGLIPSRPTKTRIQPPPRK